MKSKIASIGGLTAGVLVAVSATLIAGQVTLPNTFTAGTPAKALEVNANFNAVANEVNDNAIRITTMESNVAGGNFVLAPSTATEGNILKGADRFIHDFGTNNTFVGLNAGNFAMTGATNTASGVNTLQSNTTGFGNTAHGVSALQANTAGRSNTALGMEALRDNTSGDSNTASGRLAMLTNRTGSNNIAVGVSALRANTTGSNNIAVGVSAGTNLTTGSNNIAIGNAGVGGESATIRIGTAGIHTRSFIAGIRGVTTDVADAIAVVVDSAGQLGTVSSSRRVKDAITDMGATSSVLMQLRPVTFYYKSDRNPQGRRLQYGLIAEEVAKVAPGLVAHSDNGNIETVFYQHLAPMLLNEYQKQQRTIGAQAVEIAKLKRQTARIEALEQQAARMTAALVRLERAGTTTTAAR